MSARRIATAAGALLGLAGLSLGLGGTFDAETPQRATERPPTTCYEDQPCWKCDSMGNRVCGPVVLAPNDDGAGVLVRTEEVRP